MNIQADNCVAQLEEELRRMKVQLKREQDKNNDLIVEYEAEKRALNEHNL